MSDKENSKENFVNNFNNLREKYEKFLKERSSITTIDNLTGEVFDVKGYKHPRLRSAFRSIKTNLPYLFTYKKPENQILKIPNTTNACDGKQGLGDASASEAFAITSKALDRV